MSTVAASKIGAGDYINRDGSIHDVAAKRTLDDGSIRLLTAKRHARSGSEWILSPDEPVELVAAWPELP